MLHRLISKSYFKARLARNASLREWMMYFKTNETRGTEELREMQWSRLAVLLRHAAKNVPYYRQLFQENSLNIADLLNPAGFSKIPLLTKPEIQNHLDQLTAENYVKKELIRSGTGGSTGQPTPFYHDSRYFTIGTALKWRNYMWTGWKLGDPRAKVWGSAFDVTRAKNLEGEIFNWLENVSILPAFEMSSTRIQEMVNQIRKIKPTLIEGYTNPLVTIARAAQAQNIRLDNLGVKAVVNAAETLYQPQREVLAEVFGCKVFNRYGGREASDIAQECEYGTFHINDDWLYIEITDETGKPVLPGVKGQIVITSLFNYGMPFIRYAVQDIGELSEETNCPCGRKFHVLKNLQGRVQDLIVLPQGGYLPGEFFPHLLKDFDIRQFQVIQQKIDLIDILIIPRSKLRDENILYLKQKINQFAPGITINVQLVDSIPTSASGKFRFTISHVDSSIGLKSLSIGDKGRDS